MSVLFKEDDASLEHSPYEAVVKSPANRHENFHRDPFAKESAEQGENDNSTQDQVVLHLAVEVKFFARESLCQRESEVQTHCQGAAVDEDVREEHYHDSPQSAEGVTEVFSEITV